MEVACGQHNQRIAILVSHNTLRRHPDAAKMGDIVRRIISKMIFVEPALITVLPLHKFHHPILLLKRE